MNLLLTGVTIADPNSEFNHQVCDVRVVQGMIVEIGKALKPQSSSDPLEKEELADGTGAFLSPGFFDLNCAVGDPGFMAGLLDFVMDHEPTLLQFCEATGTKPEAVARAHAALSGFRGDTGSA